MPETNHKGGEPQKKRVPFDEREANRQKILDMAKNACNNGGGYALIDTHFAVIDMRKYRAVNKDEADV